MSAGRHADADGRRRCTPAARPGGARRGGRGRVRVAILGGTGSFGRALAGRLAALGQDEIVIGSRDAARARAAAAELGAGVEGRRTPTPSGRRPRCARREGRRGARNRRVRSATRSARRRSSRSRATSASPATGSGPTPTRSPSPSGSRSSSTRLSSPGFTRSRPPTSTGPRRTRTRSSAATTRRRRSSRSRLPRGSWPAARSTPARSPGARTLEGLTAVIVNLNRRYRAHAGITVTGIPDA